MASRQNLLWPLSLHFLATSAESCRNMCWEGNTVDSSYLCLQHSAGGGWEIAGSGVKVSGWTTEAPARKPPDFYPTTEAEQEIGRRATGENIKRIIQFQILFLKNHRNKIPRNNMYLLFYKCFPFNDVTFWTNSRSPRPGSSTWIEWFFLLPNFQCFLLVFVFCFPSYYKNFKYDSSMNTHISTI